MANELIINVTPQETRVALLEDRGLAELYIERTKDRGIMGNIYKGKVVKVLPGMQAAFVDIGLEKASFLYVSDVYGGMEDYEEMIFQGEELPNYFNPSSLIEDLLSEGQEVLVQVSKEPLGSKGTRITSYVTLPGRYLVYMPTVDHIGVSRRIKDEKERRRLREVVMTMKPPSGGRNSPRAPGAKGARQVAHAPATGASGPFRCRCRRPARPRHRRAPPARRG